jgi:tetratricopeptide (TPR) repeat protein
MAREGVPGSARHHLFKVEWPSMRHAVIVAPPPPSPGAPVPHPTQAVQQAFARVGFRVAAVNASVDLEGDFERALGGIGSDDELLVYVAGRTRLAHDALSLLVGWDCDAALPFAMLAEATAVREPRSTFFLVEARHDGATDDAMLAADHVDHVLRALDVRARGWGVLVGVWSEASAIGDPGVWPFTKYILRALEETPVEPDDGVALASAVYEQVRAAPALNTFVQSFAFVKGVNDFALVAPGGEEGRVSLPPPSVPPISVPPSSSTLVSVPSLEPLVEMAEHARARHAWDEALAAYKNALMVVPANEPATRASLYSKIGELKRIVGKDREAESYFEKAVSAVPLHRRALAGLIELATKAGEPKRVVDYRRRLLATTREPRERAAQLVAIAEVHAASMADARAAAEALEEARELVPGDGSILERLRVLYEGLGRWPKVVEVLGALCHATSNAHRRASLRFAQADTVLARLRDEARGITLLDQALEDDPTHEKALHALVAVRTGRQEWRELESLYVWLIDRYAKMHAVERAWDACRKLGALRRDRLRDGPGAVEAFTGALRCKPDDADARAMLAELFLAKGDEPAAVVEFETIASYAPLRASTYQRLYALHTRAGRRDRAWLCALALEELGATDMDQQLVIEQFRPEGAIRPSAALVDAVWDACLRAPGADHAVAAVLRAVASAAVKARVEELRAKKRLGQLDERRKQDKTSTVTVVRTFTWASHILGVRCPELYALDEAPGGLAAAQVAEPSTALGPEVLRGLSMKDLAFLVGRHLTYYRPEHYALVFFPTLGELSTLFLGALKVVLPELPVPTSLADEVARLSKELGRYSTAEERDQLGAAVGALDDRGGRVDLGAWIRSVELTAGRAGMFLAGDMAVAMRRLKAETRTIAELTLDTKRGDLLAYSVSTKYARLRELLSVAATPSCPPPPSSARAVP